MAIDRDANSKPVRRSAYSALTSGTARFLDRIDGRTRSARRLSDLREQFERLAPQPVDDARRALIHRAAATALQCESIDSALAAGEDVDANLAMRLSASLSQLLKLAGCVADPKAAKVRRTRQRDDGEEFPEGDDDPLVAYCRGVASGTIKTDAMPNDGKAYKAHRQIGILDDRSPIDPGADHVEPEERRQPSLHPRRRIKRVRLRKED